MALNYTGTMRTASAATVAFADTMTFTFFFHHVNAFGGSSRVIEHGSCNILPTGSGTDLEIQRVHATQTGRWMVSIGGEGFDKANWVFCAITLDSSDVNNNPVFYLAQDGAASLTTAATVTENAAPIGTATNTASTLSIGNRAAGDRPWDGGIAWFCMYNAILTTDQIYEAGRAGFQATSLLRGYELVSTSGAGGENDLSANNGDATASNTPVVFNSPPRRLATKYLIRQ